MAQAPTALNKRGNKIFVDGIKFDSKPEADFYERFVKGCGEDYEVHPQFLLQEAVDIDGGRILAISYKPDFVIYDSAGRMEHVYDIKNSFGMYGIDAVNKLRFKLFAAKFGIPVEAVVVRARQFQVIAQGLSRSRPPKAPLFKHDFNYHWTEAARL